MSILLQPGVHHLIGAMGQLATPVPTTTATATLAPVASSSSSGGTLGSLSKLIGVVVFFVVAFVVIFWVSLVFWTWRDVRSRTQDTILQITATLLVAVFNLGGLFIYLIVRPRQTLAELYERQLEEESLLAEMTERQTCPTCHYRVDNEFQVCPSCGTKLRRPCPRCDHLLELKWNVCPYCGYGGGADGGSRAPSRQGARMER
ncbi:MAG TPA: zinc ribbon domain-containing protein [Ktedonobacterales bacterium]|nr:zinc ribbon domain-containing protein [Ktedonobacterales bacterium]